MNDAHVHLLLTHIPLVGTIFGVLILAFALLAKKTEAATIGLGVFIISGLAAVAVYLTGEAAEEVVEELPGISEAIIERHEEAAIFALISSIVLGVIALAGLALYRNGVPRWLTSTTLVVAVVVSGIMGWTANLGGQINHPEIRSGTVESPVGGGAVEREHSEDGD